LALQQHLLLLLQGVQLLPQDLLLVCKGVVLQ
jgi:hypothetical protein